VGDTGISKLTVSVPVFGFLFRSEAQTNLKQASIPDVSKIIYLLITYNKTLLDLIVGDTGIEPVALRM
jgi:hypothetical protein